MRALAAAPGIFEHAHSLLNTANVIHGADHPAGVAFNPRGCEVVFAHDLGCWVGDEKALQECHLAEFDAYVLELTLNWATGDLAADPKARTIEAMEVGTSAVLERLAALGIAPVAAGRNVAVPPLAGAIKTTGIVGKQKATPNIHQPILDRAVAIGAATDALKALGEVEGKLVDADDHIGSAGTIWVSPVDFGPIAHLVTEKNGVLRTLATGSKVIVGNIPPNMMYGTIGDVDVYLGPIEVVDGYERGKNEYVVQAERVGVAVWNTCAAFKQPVTP